MTTPVTSRSAKPFHVQHWPSSRPIVSYRHGVAIRGSSVFVQRNPSIRGSSRPRRIPGSTVIGKQAKPRTPRPSPERRTAVATYPSRSAHRHPATASRQSPARAFGRPRRIAGSIVPCTGLHGPYESPALAEQSPDISNQDSVPAAIVSLVLSVCQPNFGNAAASTPWPAIIGETKRSSVRERAWHGLRSEPPSFRISGPTPPRPRRS